jgi:hypothetical protein
VWAAARQRGLLVIEDADFDWAILRAQIERVRRTTEIETLVSNHLYVTCYTEGFSHFVSSMTAPVASGWSVHRVGLSPTGKRRLVTAHTLSGRCGSLR